MWWCIIPTLGRLRHEDVNFEVSWGYPGNPYLKASNKILIKYWVEAALEVC